MVASGTVVVRPVVKESKTVLVVAVALAMLEAEVAEMVEYVEAMAVAIAGVRVVELVAFLVVDGQVVMEMVVEGKSI